MTVLTEHPVTVHGRSRASGEDPAGFAPRRPAERADHVPRPRRPLSSRLKTEAGIVAGASLALYLVVAVVLAFEYQIYPIDAVARMANGFYVLYSADPHLAAIGFSWNPLQSMCDMALLLFKDLWPALASRDMAGSLVSVLAMTGAVHQLRSALEEWGVWRAPRLVLTSIFAVSPMILFFAGNGMSEALYLFTMLAVSRYLLRWVRARDLSSLVYAGIALALAYLARNEALGAGAGAAILVFCASFRSVTESLGHRARVALTDLAIFALPFTVTVAGWATASYVITRQLFPQIAANSVQIPISGASIGSLTDRIVHEAKALEALAPLLPVVLVVALALAARRRDASMLAPLAVLGGGLGFDLVGYMGGTLDPWLRFYILAIPLCVLSLGFVIAVALGGSRPLAPRGVLRSRQGGVAAGASLLGLAVLAPSLVTSAAGMLSPSIGAGETSQYLAPIFDAHPPRWVSAALGTYSHVQSIDSYLDAMHLHRGDVVVDNDDTCVPNLVVDSTDPEMFMIPNDRSFKKVAADPLTFGTHYILIPPETGLDSVGQLAHEYPGLYETGDGFSSLAHQFPAGGLCPPFRLYEVLGHPSGTGGYE